MEHQLLRECTLIYNSQDMKTNQVSVNVRMDKKMQYINTIKYLA